MSNWRLFKNVSKSIYEEAPEVEMNDGAHTIFLSTKGSNEHEVPEELVKFLKFVGAKPSDSEKDLKVLTEWNKLAAKSNSIEEFVGKM